MTGIEKMQRYISKTKMNDSDRFYLDMKEAFELGQRARESKDFPLEIINLAFMYGKAKGYRAAKAEGRTTA